jgi:lipid II:glycine glycyltransferase (peptidoglycan interpeptide bridge formation enzyme)
MIKLLSYNEIDAWEWQQLVDHSPVTSFFQTKECYDFYASLSFLKPFVFGVSENEKLVGILCGYIISDGGLIKQYFSRRAIVPGGVLLTKDINEGAITALLKAIQKYLTGKSIYTEIRNYSDFNSFRGTFEKAGFIYQSHLNFQVPTLSIEQALKNLNTTKRRDVKISLKSGAEILKNENNEDVREYYAILSDLYRKRIKTPLFPFEFFEKIIELESSKLFVIKYENKVVGGSLCVACGKSRLYEWFVCGLDGDYKNIFPSTLATWAAIEYAAENNFDYFDMMGAGKPDESYGVREFKSKFGGELVENGRFLYIQNRFLYHLGKTIIKNLKKKR